MKKLLLLFVLITAPLFAQTGSTAYNQLTGSDLNEVTYKIDSFTSKSMRLTKKGDQKFKHTDTGVIVTQHFQKFNAPEKTMAITYSTTPKGNRLYVNDITVTGNQELLIDFYVKFWDTTIQLDTTKSDLLANSRYLNDQVKLYAGNTQKITVTGSK
tara:strand:- start:1823 stop:2290 length:468 start_codon:yes stop_codon:yes gene_type:complete